MSLNLLHDAIVPLEGPGGSRLDTLPGALAAFASSEAHGFGQVRPHQKHGVHMFMVQVACMGMEAKDLSEIPVDRDAWRECLIALAPEAAWSLVSEDPTQPAFLQPPMPETDFGRAKAKTDNHCPSPDDVTVLVRSKNHTVKFSRMVAPTPWHWALSLIELQTLSGLGGRMLYGTARMNGGYGTRFMVGVYDDLTPAAMWRRDVARVLALLPMIKAAVSAYREPGPKHGALWALPWDGESKLPLTHVHPLFVDVCRRMRLFLDPQGRIVSTYLPTDAARVAGSQQNGLLGDPWAPTNVKNGSSLGIKQIDVRVLRELVLGGGDIKPSPLQAFDRDDPRDMFFRLSAVIGGQGKTEGCHEVTIPVPKRIVSTMLFGSPSRLGDAADGMLADAQKAWSCLRKGVFGFVQGGKDDIKWKDHAPSDAASGEASRAFKAAYEEVFFESLWRQHDGAGDEEWVALLKAQAISVLDRIMKSHGSRTQLEFKARAAAGRMFNGSWSKEFPAIEASR